MRTWFERHRGEILGALLLCVTALALANVLKESSVSLRWLKDNKDAIAAATGILTTVLVFLGGIFSYSLLSRSDLRRTSGVEAHSVSALRDRRFPSP